MKMTDYMIGMLIMGACFLSLYGVLSHLAAPENYNIDVDDNYKDTYNKIDEITKDFNQTKNAIIGTTGDKDTSYLTLPIDFFRNTINAVFGTVKGIKGTLEFGFEMISSFVTDLHLPDWAGGLLTGCLVVLVVGMLLYIFIGRKV